MINVTKSFLPEFDEYVKYLKQIWGNNWLTNNGPLVQKLEAELKYHLGVKHLLFCGNGTIVLQMAIKALNLKKEIITTPFSYVATLNSIIWENCTPVFVDINPDDFTIDSNKIEASITTDTEAILATHVYGIPCNLEKISALGARYNLKVIYDGAHSFDCKINNESVFNFGDISTCSLHATKLFHSVEGGLIITNDDIIAKQLYLMRQFGHVYDEYYIAGINAKNSEFHAAMGLCILPHLSSIISHRQHATEIYKSFLTRPEIIFPKFPVNFNYNFSYFPIVLQTQDVLLTIKKELEAQNIYPRRYFYPSLNTLRFNSILMNCPVSESIAERVLCLPLSHDINDNEITLISEIILKYL